MADNPPLPAGFVARMEHLLGAEYAAFGECFHQSPEQGVRTNTLKISPQGLAKMAELILEPVPWCPAGFRMMSQPGGNEITPGKHPLHAAGLYYLQDPSAMAAAEILAPKPGEIVLDLAAAPGGKTSQLAALMENQGLLVANEIHPRRVWDLAENLERCGITNAAITNETPQRLAAYFGPFFDRVLVDAPCSGEGMFRKNPEARRAWSLELVQSCASRQAAILRSAAQMVRPDGHLVYSTCTFAPEENESVLARFLNEQLPDGMKFEVVTIQHQAGFAQARPDWSARESTTEMHLERAIRLWPQRGAAEGHFIGLLKRLDNPKPTQLDPYPTRLAEPTRRLSQQFFKDTLYGDLPLERLALQGSYLYQIPVGLPRLEKLKVIHPGWWVGIVRKGRIEPGHALALGLKAKQARQITAFPLESLQINSYLHGESLPDPGPQGWTLVAIQDRSTGAEFPLGWSKRSQGVLKNFYPRGLRWL